MAPAAVDTWARDMAGEAKELAVQVNAKHDAHDARCNERHVDRMNWEERTTTKVDGIRKEMWVLAISGLVAIVTAQAIVAWALIQKIAGLS